MTLIVTIWWSVWSMNDLIAEHLHKKHGYSYLYMYLIALVIVITILFLCNLQIVGVNFKKIIHLFKFKNLIFL